MKKKIAFIKFGNFSYVNDRLKEQLEKNFSTYPVQTFDVLDVLKSKLFLLVNIFFTLKEYGRDIFFAQRNIKSCFFRTTFFFKEVKLLMARSISSNTYIFSIQTQSLFDASCPGVPHFVYTDHTHLTNLGYAYFNKKKLYQASWIKMERTIYEHAAINFTMSSNVSMSLINNYGCPQDRVICAYVGSSISMPDKINENKSYANRNILFVGLDWKRKGGAELIEAFKIVLQFCPDAKLTIVGCSPKITVPNCKVVGKVDIKEMAQYYERASLFCLPTKLEPFGIVFIEAMTWKLPVVATNIGAVPDFISDGENGYLVEPGNINQLADRLITLIRDPNKCRTFGEKSFDIICNRYTWDKVGKVLENNIRPVINKGIGS